jgi:nucleotide-binding universal stress UspA family protein
MGKILCATRGGEASVQTQMAAISRAKESGDDLEFFYAVDLEFLAQADYALRSDIVEEEMGHMAEFLMVMAVERAEEQGVKATYVIRNGNFAEEIASAAKEEAATLVVVGRPADEDNQFDLGNLKEMLADLQRQTGVPFVILPEAPSHG